MPRVAQFVAVGHTGIMPSSSFGGCCRSKARRHPGTKKTSGSLRKTGEGGLDLKVGVAELQEQLGKLEEAGISIKQITQQAMNENGHKIFDIFRQGKEDVRVSSRARWNAQLKGLVELEKKMSK